MNSVIPAVDMSQYDMRDSASLAKLGRALGECARGMGFFVLTNPSVPAPLRERVFAQSARFFAADSAAKVKCSIQHTGNNRGYVALGEERLNAAMPGDVKEAFNIGWDLPADHADVIARKPFRGPNVWPDAQALPHFRATMLEYFNACHQLGMALHRALALELGVAENFFDDKLDEPLATLRLLRYPPRPAQLEAGQIGAGEHTDYGNLTLLVTDDAGGLEVRTRGDEQASGCSGEWLAVPNIPGAIICNIGDCLMRWSNDVFVSTPHRVVNPVGRERFSVAFFLDPNPDAVVACLPTCASADRPAKYAPTTGAAYLKARLDATYGASTSAG